MNAFAHVASFHIRLLNVEVTSGTYAMGLCKCEVSVRGYLGIMLILLVSVVSSCCDVCYSESERREEAKKRLGERLEKRENT